MTDDGLAGRANDVQLVELFAARVSDDGELRRESFYVLGFFLDEAHRHYSSGKYAFLWPVALERGGRSFWIFSQIA